MDIGEYKTWWRVVDARNGVEMELNALGKIPFLAATVKFAKLSPNGDWIYAHFIEGTTPQGIWSLTDGKKIELPPRATFVG